MDQPIIHLPDEEFLPYLERAWAVEDYVLKQLRRIGYGGTLDHRIIRATRPGKGDSRNSQSDNGDVALWHEDTDTFICDIKTNFKDLNWLLNQDFPVTAENVLEELRESEPGYLWLSAENSIISILTGDIDISHYKWFIAPQPEFREGPDGKPVVWTHIPWLIQVDGANFDPNVWRSRKRNRSRNRTHNWYTVPVDDNLKVIDLSLERLEAFRSDHNPTAGSTFCVADRIALDLNSYRQEI